MHETCRSCHVPPDPPRPDGILTDCAVCHVPEPATDSLYPLLLDGAVLRVEFGPRTKEEHRTLFRRMLNEAIERSPLSVLPDGGPVVRIRVDLAIAEGRTDRGASFFAARATAVVTVHRARVEVDAGPGVDTNREEATRKALRELARRVALVVS